MSDSMPYTGIVILENTAEDIEQESGVDDGDGPPQNPSSLPIPLESGTTVTQLRHFLRHR
jgi:hypothetical protein